MLRGVIYGQDLPENRMEISIRRLKQEDLPGFQPYLMPETVLRLSRGDPGVLALGASSGRYSCGAAAAYLSGDGTELTDLFVDSAVRRQGIGGRLLDALLARLDSMGRSQVQADYVLRGGGLLGMDILLITRGFCLPWTRSKVYAVPAEKLMDNRVLGRAFSSGYRTAAGILPLSGAPEGAVLELEQTAAAPLRWSTLKDRVDPELSAVMMRDGKAAAYQLMGEASDGVALLAAVSGPSARPADFILLLRETLNRCWYWKGGWFTVYVSAINSKSDRLAVRLTEGRSIVYEEHVCVREGADRRSVERKESI